MFKHAVKAFLIFVIFIISIFGLYYAYNWFTGNFHVVTANEAYRSKQLNKKQLDCCINKYAIKSILNLRGDEPGAKWYEDEINISSYYGIKHYDFELPAMFEPEEKDMIQIINILKTAPKPMLIHCLGGADRSGLVSAIWKIVIDKESKEKAARQLSIFYGHMPFGKARAMDRWLATRDIDENTCEIKKQNTENKQYQ